MTELFDEGEAERLREENKRLREALDTIRVFAAQNAGGGVPVTSIAEFARAALKTSV